MTRSQLREVIKSIVRKKLLENSSEEHSKDARLATFTKNHSEWNSFDKISVLSHYGSHPLEITEFWIDKSKKTLCIGVIADVPPKLEELTSTTTNSSGATQQTPAQSQDGGDQMSDSDRSQIENLQKQQSKFTSDAQRIDGAISKLREPLERKIGQLEKRKADIQRKLGTVTDKTKRIQDKYSKVFENVNEDGMQLVNDPKYTFSVAFKSKFDSPNLKRELTHRIDVFPANSKEELPKAIANWLQGYVDQAKAKGKEGIAWQMIPNTLQIFSQEKA